jgi:hypothetical protein
MRRTARRPGTGPWVVSGGRAKAGMWDEFEFVAIPQNITNRRGCSKVGLIGRSPQCEPARVRADSGPELNGGMKADHLTRYVLLLPDDEHSDRVSHDAKPRHRGGCHPVPDPSRVVGSRRGHGEVKHAPQCEREG